MCQNKISNVYSNIESYYTNKVSTHGATPKGVDWNSEESQNLRFEQLSKIIKQDDFSIADIGCGYGKYCDYLELNFNQYHYLGYDLSNEMIVQAQMLYKNNNVNFLKVKNITEISKVEYCIASGIFSVKMQHKEAEWLSYILEILDVLNEKSKNGFSFNMLTKYSDKECMRDDLYYADPLFFFDYCKRNFSKNISLLHDYELYEFTILVRKD